MLAQGEGPVVGRFAPLLTLPLLASAACLSVCAFGARSAGGTGCRLVRTPLNISCGRGLQFLPRNRRLPGEVADAEGEVGGGVPGLGRAPIHRPRRGRGKICISTEPSHFGSDGLAGRVVGHLPLPLAPRVLAQGKEQDGGGLQFLPRNRRLPGEVADAEGEVGGGVPGLGRERSGFHRVGDHF